MDSRDIRFLAKALTAPPNLKVNFVVAGVQKAGTTAFHDYLTNHPQICLPHKKKEVHFFDDDKYFDRWHGVRYGLRNRFYHSYFKPRPQQRIVGEVTPSYMYWADAPRRIWEYNPKMKWVMILRDPISRAFSHWNMQRARNLETLSFWEGIQQEDQRYTEFLQQSRRRFAYVDRGFYTEQLRRIWHFFPREQTLIFKSEELMQHPQEVLSRTYAFLGLNDFIISNPQTSNVRDYPIELEPQERAYLQSIYEFEIKALERMLNWDCSSWLS